MDIHNHWLRQEVQKDLIMVEYTESTLMIVDGLTKVLTNNAFECFMEQMNLKDVSNLLAERRLNDLEELKLDQVNQLRLVRMKMKCSLPIDCRLTVGSA